MNKNQRIVLIIGAIVLLIALFSTPSYVQLAMTQGRILRYDPDSEYGRELIKGGLAKTFDIGNALVRGIAVAGVTLLVCYALKDKKGIEGGKDG
jgi:hypothetical protein